MTGHHTVPQFYLRNFANKAGQVALVSRKAPSRRILTSVLNAAVETGFYRIDPRDLLSQEDQATFDPESVEAGLSHLEHAWKPTIQKLVDGDFASVDSNDWYRLIQFTAVQSVRGNRWRNRVGRMATEAARQHIIDNLDAGQVRAWLVAQGRPSGPSDVASFVNRIADPKKFPCVVPPKSFLVQESMKMGIGNPETENGGLGQYLAGKHIDLIRATNATVLTSDEPVCWWSPESDEAPYALAQVIWVPLSPALVVQFREPGFDLEAHGWPGRSSAASQDETVSMVNAVVAAQAERWVIHHPDDPECH